MRIALVALHTSPGATPGFGDAGGMNVVVAAQAQALSALGHEVLVATRATTALPAGDYPLRPNETIETPEAPEAASRRAARLHALPAGAPELRKEGLIAVLPEFTEQLSALGPFDAVHAHYWLSGLATLPVAAESNTTLALTLHTVAAQKNAHLAAGDRPEPAVRLESERLLTQQAFIIAGSASEARSISEHYGAPRHGSTIIHPGVDTELFRPECSPRQLGTADTLDRRNPRFRLTVLGRVQPLKGQCLALEAAAALARRDPALWSQCELVIAGEATPGAEPYAAELRQLASDLGVADRVRFLPAQGRASAASLLAATTVAIIPSHSETFGLVALEAAASGVPSVVGAHTGLIEAAPAGVSAVHVTGRDPEHWAEAVARLLHDDQRRAQLGASAQAHALTQTWASRAQQLADCYVAAKNSSSSVRATSSGFCTGGDFMK